MRHSHIVLFLDGFPSKSGREQNGILKVNLDLPLQVQPAEKPQQQTTENETECINDQYHAELVSERDVIKSRVVVQLVWLKR